jgi:hypothetical protein
VPAPPIAAAWIGPGRHVVTYPLRGGKLMNFVGVVERSDWTTESSKDGRSLELISARMPIPATILTGDRQMFLPEPVFCRYDGGLSTN